jgi:hypothetical protein
MYFLLAAIIFCSGVIMGVEKGVIMGVIRHQNNIPPGETYPFTGATYGYYYYCQYAICDEVKLFWVEPNTYGFNPFILRKSENCENCATIKY